MGKLAVSVILAVIFCCVCGCAVLGRKYVEKEMGYSIRPPANWVESTPDRGHRNIKEFVSPHLSEERLRSSLNIVVEDADLQIEEYVEKQKNEVLPRSEGFELLAEEPVEIGKRWRLVYRLSEAKTGERIVCFQDTIVEQGKVYVLRFIASEVQWERMKETFALSADTFKVKRKQ